MNESVHNNKRIAKNTFYMYTRMLLVMGVSLYTSRVILNALGIDNYGIFTVVAGVVGFFSFINSSMTSSLNRFFSFSIGENNIENLRTYFQQGFLAFVIISIGIIVLGETVGLAVFYHLTIPEGRETAAMWVFQLSLLNLVVNFLRIPYNAMIIAHEKMNFFALMGVIEAILKLGAAFLIMIVPIDRLIFYMIFLSIVTIAINQSTIIFCKKNKLGVQLSAKVRWNYIKELLSFSGWSLLTSASHILANQGVIVVLNNAFGVVVSAACGIANQVMTAITGFLGNFQIAYNPQIIKTYAADERRQFENLIFRMSKLSFFLMVVICSPLLIKMPEILKFWLKTVPEWASGFCTCIVLVWLLESFTGPFWMGIQAVGKIRTYQIVNSVVISLTFIGAIVCIKLGYSPLWAYIIKVIIAFITLFVRVFMFRNCYEFPVLKYFVEIFLRSVIVFGLAVFTLFWYSKVFHGDGGLILFVISGVLISGFYIFILGLSKIERSMVLKFIRR